MKQKLLFLGTAALATLLAVVPASAATQLKGAHFLSPKHPVGVAYDYYASEIKRLTKGSVTMRVFPGESLLGAKAISDGIRDGVADVGQVVMTYTPSYYPHGVLINDMAMVGPDDLAAAMAVTELYLLNCKACLAEFGKQGQIPLSGISTPAYYIIAKGDMNSLDKIRAKKLRAAGSLWARLSNAIGAVPVNMPTAGMYEAISRGTLDGALYAIGGLKTHGLGDVATQVIMLNTGSFRAAALFSFGKKSWAKLTMDERKAILRATANGVVRNVNEYLKGDEAGLQVAKEKNIPIVQPAPDLQKARDEFVAHDLENTIKGAKDKLGIDDAAAFVANYKKFYAKYEAAIKPIRKDEGKLADLLYNEVYTKLDMATFGMK